MVGREASMRVSSSTLPSLIGTLKSTRMKTRSPLRGRSLMDNLATKIQSTDYTDFQNNNLCNLWMDLQSLAGDILDQIAHTTRVAPLVVVPRKHLQHLSADHFRVLSIDDRRIRVSPEIN